MRLATSSWQWTVGILALALVAAASVSSGRSAEELGPPLGTKAPDIGTRLDQDGKPRTFADLTGQHGLVLMFNRSAGWCPYCQAQMIELNGGIGEIEKRGFRVAILTYDTPDVLKGFSTRRSITYPLLSDPNSEVIDAYGLRDPQYPPGHRAHGVPRPLILVLDRAGMIRAKLYEDSYKVRPSVAAIIAKLDEVGPRS
jgi:peroxiredoxin